jgi:hypothetical protein
MLQPAFLARLKILIVIESTGFTKTHWAQLKSQGVTVILPTSLANYIQIRDDQKYIYDQENDWIPLVRSLLDANNQNPSSYSPPSLAEHCRILNQIISNFHPNEN